MERFENSSTMKWQYNLRRFAAEFVYSHNMATICIVFHTLCFIRFFFSNMMKSRCVGYNSQIRYDMHANSSFITAYIVGGISFLLITSCCRCWNGQAVCYFLWDGRNYLKEFNIYFLIFSILVLKQWGSYLLKFLRNSEKKHTKNTWLSHINSFNSSTASARSSGHKFSITINQNNISITTNKTKTQRAKKNSETQKPIFSTNNNWFFAELWFSFGWTMLKVFDRFCCQNHKLCKVILIISSFRKCLFLS